MDGRGLTIKMDGNKGINRGMPNAIFFVGLLDEYV
jgi:hypothetical protein